MRRATEREFLQEPSPLDDPGGIFSGTVGWGDRPHYDIKPGGPTFVKVTLYDGRNPRQQVDDDGLAHGLQILARVGAPLHRVPPPGTQVMVAMAAGQWAIPGSAVIFTAVEPSPDHQYSADRVKQDYGEQDLVLKARSITLTDQEDRYMYVGPNGIKIADPDGSSLLYRSTVWTLTVSKGNKAVNVMQWTEAKMRVSCRTENGTTSGAMTLTPDKCSMLCTSFAVSCANAAIGANASPATPAVWGSTGQSGLGSTTIFIQP